MNAAIECYAYCSKDGDLIADSDFKTEGDAWRVGLGWPNEDDITQDKARGGRVFKVKITEIRTEENK